MIGFIIKKIIGSKNEREVRRLRPLVAKINASEAELQGKPDDYLRQKTAEWKDRCKAIQDNDELKKALEEILPEAFAVVKNTCRRLVGTEVTVRGHPSKWEMVPFDVQLIGGYALHCGRIAEMATGAEEQVQRGHYFAIVDEVDSIFIDEARTPLIISGPSVMNSDHGIYDKYKPQVESLFHTQEKLCTRFLCEAEELMPKLRPE